MTDEEIIKKIKKKVENWHKVYHDDVGSVAAKQWESWNTLCEIEKLFYQKEDEAQCPS